MPSTLDNAYEEANCLSTLILAADAKVLSSTTCRATFWQMVKSNQIDALFTSGEGILADLRSCVPQEDHHSTESALRDWLTKKLPKLIGETSKRKIQWSPTQFLRRLGLEIDSEESILYWCYKNRIPVFCPSLFDGLLGEVFYYTYSEDCCMDMAFDNRFFNDFIMKAHSVDVLLLGDEIQCPILTNCLKKKGVNSAVCIGFENKWRVKETASTKNLVISTEPPKSGTLEAYNDTLLTLVQKIDALEHKVGELTEPSTIPKMNSYHPPHDLEDMADEITLMLDRVNVICEGSRSSKDNSDSEESESYHFEEQKKHLEQILTVIRNADDQGAPHRDVREFLHRKDFSPQLIQHAYQLYMEENEEKQNEEENVVKFAEDHVEDTDHVEETSSLEEPNEDSQNSMEDRARMSEEDDSHSDSGEDLSPQHSPTPPATDPSPILLSPMDPVFDPTTDDPDDIPKRGPEQKGSLQEMFKNAESDEEVLDRVKVKKKRKPEFPNDSENTTDVKRDPERRASAGALFAYTDSSDEDESPELISDRVKWKPDQQKKLSELFSMDAPMNSGPIISNLFGMEEEDSYEEDFEDKQMKPTAKNKRNPEKRGGIRELLTEKKKKENPDHKRLPERKMSVGGYFDHSDEELSDLEADISNDHVTSPKRMPESSGKVTDLFTFEDDSPVIKYPDSVDYGPVKDFVNKLFMDDDESFEEKMEEADDNWSPKSAEQSPDGYGSVSKLFYSFENSRQISAIYVKGDPTMLWPIIWQYSFATMGYARGWDVRGSTEFGKGWRYIPPKFLRAAPDLITAVGLSIQGPIGVIRSPVPTGPLYLQINDWTLTDLVVQLEVPQGFECSPNPIIIPSCGIQSNEFYIHCTGDVKTGQICDVKATVTPTEGLHNVYRKVTIIKDMIRVLAGISEVKAAETSFTLIEETSGEELYLEADAPCIYDTQFTVKPIPGLVITPPEFTLRANQTRFERVKISIDQNFPSGSYCLELKAMPFHVHNLLRQNFLINIDINSAKGIHQMCLTHDGENVERGSDHRVQIRFENPTCTALKFALETSEGLELSTNRVVVEAFQNESEPFDCFVLNDAPMKTTLSATCISDSYGNLMQKTYTCDAFDIITGVYKVELEGVKTLTTESGCLVIMEEEKWETQLILNMATEKAAIFNLSASNLVFSRNPVFINKGEDRSKPFTVQCRSGTKSSDEVQTLTARCAEGGNIEVAEHNFQYRILPREFHIGLDKDLVPLHPGGKEVEMRLLSSGRFPLQKLRCPLSHPRIIFDPDVVSFEPEHTYSEPFTMMIPEGDDISEGPTEIQFHFITEEQPKPSVAARTVMVVNTVEEIAFDANTHFVPGYPTPTRFILDSKVKGGSIFLIPQPPNELVHFNPEKIIVEEGENSSEQFDVIVEEGSEVSGEVEVSAEVRDGRPNLGHTKSFSLPLELLTHINLIVRFVGGRNQFDFPLKVVANRDFTQVIEFVMECYGFDDAEAAQIKLMYKKKELPLTDTILEVGIEDGEMIRLIQPESLGRQFVFGCLDIKMQKVLHKNDFADALIQNGILDNKKTAELVFRMLDFEGLGHITYRAFQKIISPEAKMHDFKTLVWLILFMSEPEMKAYVDAQPETRRKFLLALGEQVSNRHKLERLKSATTSYALFASFDFFLTGVIAYNEFTKMLEVMELKFDEVTTTLVFHRFTGSRTNASISLAQWNKIVGDEKRTLKELEQIMRDIASGFSDREIEKARRGLKSISKKSHQKRQPRQYLGLSPLSDIDMDALYVDVLRCQKTMELNFNNQDGECKRGPEIDPHERKRSEGSITPIRRQRSKSGKKRHKSYNRGSHSRRKSFEMLLQSKFEFLEKTKQKRDPV